MILELSKKHQIASLCKEMGIKRDGFYKWLKRLNNPVLCKNILKRNDAIELFIKYHNTYPSHGYKWLTALINTENGTNYSFSYGHKICKFTNIRSKAKHSTRRYLKTHYNTTKYFPNLILKHVSPNRPFEIIVSDMTAFRFKKQYYELTLFMDLYNNEIISYGLSKGHGGTNHYYNALKDLIAKKSLHSNFKTILHTDHGSIYASDSFNKLLEINNFIHTMSKPGTPTENGAMESINGWIKEEFYKDLQLESFDNIEIALKNYVDFFNNTRPAAALNYLTPIKFKELNYKKYIA